MPSTTYDAITAITNDTASPAGVNHTCSGDNRVLFVVWAYHDALQMTSFAATYNGVSMTKIGELYIGSWEGLVVFRLANPASGSNAVSISWTGTPDSSYGFAVSVNNADITGTPERTVFTNSSVVNPSDSGITVTDALINDLIMDFGLWADDTTGTLTPPSGATLRGTSSGAYASIRVYSEAVVADGSQVQAFSVNALKRTGHIGFAVKSVLAGYPKIMVY